MDTFNIMRRFVIGFITFVFIAIFCTWIAYGIIGFKVYKAIDKDGLKGVTERVWNGKMSVTPIAK